MSTSDIQVKNYLGVRVTASPADVAEYVSKLWPDRDDVFWCNHPPDDDVKAMHAHIVVPCEFQLREKVTAKRPLGHHEREALKLRITRVLGIKGNAQFATSIYTNGIVSAMTYMKHAPTELHGSEGMKALFHQAPPWVENRPDKVNDEDTDDLYRLGKTEKDMMLSESNIVWVMKRFARVTNNDGGFEAVLTELMSKTRWRLSTTLKRNRISQEHVEAFETGPEASAKTWVARYMPYGYKGSSFPEK